MNCRLGNVLSVMLMAGAVLFAAPMVKAQKQAHNGPSKYLYLQNLSLKPGTLGQFTKLQQEENVALREAKAPGHFLTMEQITGSNLLISVEGFNSFSEMQKIHEEVWSNAKLATILRTDNRAQDELVRKEYESIYRFRKDLSLHADQSLENMRFMRIWLVHVKPGHAAEFENIAKTEMKALDSQADVHWAVFEKMYGVGSDVTFMVATPMKSLSEIDTMIANRKKIRGMVGEGLIHLVMATESKAVSSSEEDLFVFAPKLSYVPEAWVSASPDFWGKQ